jgi:hypothetical protein
MCTFSVRKYKRKEVKAIIPNESSLNEILVELILLCQSSSQTIFWLSCKSFLPMHFQLKEK